jgi:TorA maturation chaperone TorD
MINTERLQSLSRLFSYPEKWPDARDLETIAPQWRARWDGSLPQNRLQDLQAVYISLFVNALPEIPCPPYGSYYLEGTLMGPSTVRLNKLYNEYGFESKELADHIAVELEFLAFLACYSTLEDVKANYEFLLTHLKQWTPAFFEQVEETDRSGLYRALCASAADFIFHDVGRKRIGRTPS